MFSILDGRAKFYQWDLDRKIVVDDESINQVHFCNRTDECSLVCDVYDLDGKRVADVPNVLLQQDWRINVYGYDKNYTKHNEVFDVVRRSKPADYVYTETEVKNYDDLAERIDQIEKNGISDEAVEGAVEKYLEENDIKVDLTGYATEKYVDDAIAAIPEVDLSDYAKKTDIPSTSGLATESYVDEKFNSIEVPDVDLEGYATEQFVKDEITKAQLSGGDVEVDLSNYYTKSEVDEKIETIELTPGPVGPQGEPGKDGQDGAPGKDGADYVLTEADKQEIAGMVEVSGGDVEVDLTNYYTKSEVDALIPDTSGFTTEERVIALINEYGASGDSLPAAEGVEF